MKVKLFINYYTQESKERQEELDLCVKFNAAIFDEIFIFTSIKDYQEGFLMSYPFPNKANIIFIGTHKLTFNDYFEMFESDCVNIISNLDIIITRETIDLIPKYFEENRKRCLALTRYDINKNKIENNIIEGTFFDRTDSQDTWVFYGNVDKLEEANFGLGVAGCDNSIAYHLNKNGYDVINPSLTLKTYHYHNSNIRYWNQGEYETIPPPYLLLPTTY